jgi:predicted chitinase
MGIISTKLRNSAKGQPCMFQIPGICNHDPATVVLAHLPSEIKGMGNKSDDFHAAFACQNCHEAIDNHRLSREDCLYYSMRALQRTMRNWVSRGLVVVPEDTHRHKPLSKTVARRHIGTGETL